MDENSHETPIVFGPIIQEISEHAKLKLDYGPSPHSVDSSGNGWQTPNKFWQTSSPELPFTQNQVIPSEHDLTALKNSMPPAAVQGTREKHALEMLVQDAKLILKDQDSSQLECELKAFTENESYNLDLNNFLANFRKQSAPNLDLSHYTIQRDSGQGTSRIFPKRYYDAPYSFVLCYDEDVIANISFEAQYGAILITQIQGRHGSQDKLQNLKWERGLLALVCDWAQENSIPEVRVQPHHKNHYTRVREDKRFKLLYDVTAKRSGFFYDVSMELFRKIITSVQLEVPVRSLSNAYN